MPVGTAEPALRGALVDLLATELGAAVAVQYEAPAHATDLAGDTGLHDAIWTDATDTTLEVPVLGTSPLWYDEDVTIVVACQTIRDRTEATQRQVDDRAAELLGEVIAVLAAHPDLGFTDTAAAQMRWCRVAGHRKTAGVIGGDPAFRACRYEITVRAQVRLKLTT